MLAYGCPRVFYKMDNEGNGEEIRIRNLGANEDIDLLNWLPSRFQEMCILAGCETYSCVVHICPKCFPGSQFPMHPLLTDTLVQVRLPRVTTRSDSQTMSASRFE